MNLYGRIIKHQSNKDIAYLVDKCYDVGHKVKLKVSVINMGHKVTIPTRFHFNIVIRKENYWRWHVCLDPYDRCIRYAEWKAIV